MPLERWMAIATLVTAPIAVTAQEKTHPASPDDPAAAVSPYRYESAFSRYQSMPETEEAPEKAWRAANDEMGKLGGHAGHVKAAPASPRREGPSPDHANHGMDHESKGK